MITENNYKYPKAPTIEQIDAVIEKAGISELQFERFHGLYKGCIKQVRNGFRTMPSKYWHLFFEPTKVVVSKRRSNGVQNKETRPASIRKTDSLSSLIS